MCDNRVGYNDRNKVPKLLKGTEENKIKAEDCQLMTVDCTKVS